MKRPLTSLLSSGVFWNPIARPRPPAMHGAHEGAPRHRRGARIRGAGGSAISSRRSSVEAARHLDEVRAEMDGDQRHGEDRRPRGAPAPA